MSKKNYSKMVHEFPARASARARYLKAVKECAIVIQDFELAVRAREVQKRLEAYIPKRKRGGGK